MRNVKRYYLANAEYFITIVTYKRQAIFTSEPSIEMLKQAFREAYSKFPYFMRAYVLLPNHIHALIKPKEKTEHISAIIGITKREFTKAFRFGYPEFQNKQIWQERFWDHIIRNEQDLKKHVDYIHFNPVKHGLVDKPENYSASTFLKFVGGGEYQLGWGHAEPDGLSGMENLIEPIFFK